MKKNTEITVLLSSYNGERFIAEQVESVLAQRDVLPEIVIRDDGSEDSTPEIIARLASTHPNITFFKGSNIGLVRSFFDLLKHANPDCPYFAFADQDDVWLPEKLSNALKMLQAHDQSTPLMYCARIEYVDASLSHLGFSPIYDTKKIGFGNALVQNIATGCTIVINRAAREKIISRLPEKCLVHDWWIYMVISALGKVLYDQRPCLKYRQHGGNAIGVSASFLGSAKSRLRRYITLTDANRASVQLTEFYKLFGDELNVQQHTLVKNMIRLNANPISRFRLAFMSGFWRQSLLDQFLLRLVILSGRF